MHERVAFTGLALTAVVAGEHSTVVPQTRLFRHRLWLRHSPLLLLPQELRYRSRRSAVVYTLYHWDWCASTVVYRSASSSHRCTRHTLWV